MGAIADWLGGLMGSLVGRLTIVGIYLLVVLVLWGLWWDRILSKAGFLGRTYWALFALLVTPFALAPLAQPGVLTEAALEWLAVGCGLSFWLGIVLVAVLPWPARRKPKGSPPTGNKPPGGR